MGKVSLYQTTRALAEDAAYYEIMGNGSCRALFELFGRLNQTYPGEFLKLKELELMKYSSYREAKVR